MLGDEGVERAAAVRAPLGFTINRRSVALRTSAPQCVSVAAPLRCPRQAKMTRARVKPTFTRRSSATKPSEFFFSFLLGARHRKHAHLFFAALEPVHGVDVDQPRALGSERLLQQTPDHLDLRLVRRNHAHARARRRLRLTEPVIARTSRFTSATTKRLVVVRPGASRSVSAASGREAAAAAPFRAVDVEEHERPEQRVGPRPFRTAATSPGFSSSASEARRRRKPPNLSGCMRYCVFRRCTG